MYERSAIVLEKYIEKVLRLNKTYNLKKNSENYSELVNEVENFQITINKDTKVIQEFDETVKKIETIQKEQQRLYNINKKLEDDRAELFNEIGEDFKILESKLKKIEDTIKKNNERIVELREEFIKNLQDFSQRQKDRNKCDKERRVSETRNIKYKEDMLEQFKQIETTDVANLKDFIASEKNQVRQEAIEIMTKNGKNERVQFNQDVLRKAINNRIDIAEKEAECYIIIYDKMKKLLAETEYETIKLDKYKKALRNISVKLAFLKAQKEYIVEFLDYERMASMSGAKLHKKMMQDACNNFELDMMQIKKLYELILKETTGKVTQKSYNDLYNKNYLKSIEDKEKNFQEEVNNVNLKTGTLINSNYWRIEGIKNIYNTFQQEVTEKFGRDLSEYRIEELEEESQTQLENNKNYYEYKKSNDNYEDEDNNEDEYEEDEYEEDEYDEDEYEEDEYEEDEYEDDEYEEDEYEEDEYEEDEYEDDEYEEDEYEEDEYEEDEYEEDEYDDDEYDNKKYNKLEKEFETVDAEELDNIIKNSRKKSNKKTTKLNKKVNSNKQKKSKKATQKVSSKNKSEKHKSEEKKDKGLFNKLFKKD